MLTEQSYKVNLPTFEGPLDLLLYLVRKNDLNLYDIPIAFITEEYLKCLEVLEELDMNQAGDFLMMAAELLLMKSRLLLPVESEGEEEEGEDPRAELARRLLIYQRFKVASLKLSERWMLGRDVFIRQKGLLSAEEEQEVPIRGEVFELTRAFSQVLKRLPKEIYHEVAMERMSISDRIYQLEGIFNQKKVVSLVELLPNPLTRYDVVITLLALLEMTRLKMIRIYQEGHCDSLTLRWIN